jgi:hypothetical protein
MPSRLTPFRGRVLAMQVSGEGTGELDASVAGAGALTKVPHKMCINTKQT